MSAAIITTIVNKRAVPWGRSTCPVRQTGLMETQRELRSGGWQKGTRYENKIWPPPSKTSIQTFFISAILCVCVCFVLLFFFDDQEHVTIGEGGNVDRQVRRAFCLWVQLFLLHDRLTQSPHHCRCCSNPSVELHFSPHLWTRSQDTWTPPKGAGRAKRGGRARPPTCLRHGFWNLYFFYLLSYLIIIAIFMS